MRNVALSPFVAFTLAICALVGSSVASAEIVRLTVIHTNDIHGGIGPSDATFMNREFPPRLGGGASMITFLTRVRAEIEEKGGHVLLMDAGDTFQGTPVGTLTKGRAVIDFMNRAGYDALALGNHDFDEGKENCMSLVQRAEFPVIAANILSKETEEVVPWVEPWIVKDFGGLRVGIIGLITPETANMSFPANVAGLEFAPMVPIVREALEELRAQDVDVIFALGHVGVPYDRELHYDRRTEEGWPDDDDPRANAMDVAHAVEGIDVFFGGHIHKGFDDAWEMSGSNTLLFQTYGRGSGCGIVTLSIDTDTNQILGYDYWSERGYLVTFFENQFWPDPEVAGVVTTEVERAEEGMDRVIGRAAADFTREGQGQSAMGNAVVDAWREETDADFAFQNLGGVRNDIRVGTITSRDVFQVLPFSNKLVVFELSGAELLEVVETRVSGGRSGLFVSGGKIVYNQMRPDFARVTSFEVGEILDPERTYRVVTTDYLAKGNSGLRMLPLIPDSRKTYTGKLGRDALEAWLIRNDPASPTVDDRWKRDDAAVPDPAFEAAVRGVRATAPTP